MDLADPAPTRTRSRPPALSWLARPEILLAVAAFLGLCVAVLSVAPSSSNRTITPTRPPSSASPTANR